MHIILGILGSIITVLVLLNRLKSTGIDFGWLNPFSWAHRRRWRKKYHADPAFSIESPMEAAAGLMYVAAKLSGEISLEEKQHILQCFERQFKLSGAEASDLLSACSFIIKNPENILAKLDKYLEPSSAKFSEEQRQSTLEMVGSVVQLNRTPSELQQTLLNRLNNTFNRHLNTNEKW